MPKRKVGDLGPEFSTSSSDNDADDDSDGFSEDSRVSEFLVKGERLEAFNGHIHMETVEDRPALKAYLDDVCSRSWDQRKDQKLLDITQLVPFLAKKGLGGCKGFQIDNVVSSREFSW
jgi:hypothetical protein